jgi:hypothetical protein
MPSRVSVLMITSAWLVVTGYSFWRDWVPYLRGDGAPVIAIDLADEAAQAVPIRWTIWRGDQPIGRLTTQMSYREADDTFLFQHLYRSLQLATGGVQVEVPQWDVQMRLTRAGDLREQQMQGNLEVQLWNLRLNVSLRVEGQVVHGQLQSQLSWDSPWGKGECPLPVTPVTRGQPLNPLLPVNRLATVRPGRRWIVHEDHPLQTALHEWLRTRAAEYGLSIPPASTQVPLMGEVMSQPRLLTWQNTQVLCWVIEYRRDETLIARTWVRCSDGKVLMQEAFDQGEHLRLVRES